MFMRFVNLKVKEESVEAFERFYEFRLAPALLEEPGCIFARLIQSDSKPTDFLSFTLWATPGDAEAYESSGHFAALVEENEPFLENTSEWKIQLSADNTLEYMPVKEKPTVEAMPIIAGSDQTDLSEDLGEDMYVRILHARIKPGSFPDVRKMYHETLVPELTGLEGCRGAYLIGEETADEVVSITLWESKANAEYYEASGKFAELVEMTRPFMSDLYQWKTSLDSEKQTRTRTSDDLSIAGYHIVTGEQLQRSQD